MSKKLPMIKQQEMKCPQKEDVFVCIQETMSPRHHRNRVNEKDNLGQRIAQIPRFLITHTLIGALDFRWNTLDKDASSRTASVNHKIKEWPDYNQKKRVDSAVEWISKGSLHGGKDQLQQWCEHWIRRLCPSWTRRQHTLKRKPEMRPRSWSRRSLICTPITLASRSRN